jgi:GTP-binding protein
VTEWDERVARKLRKSGKPIIVVANKADNPKRDVDAYTLLELGLGEVIPTSPMQSRGLDKLQDAMVAELRKLGIESHVENDDDLE